MPKPFKVVTPVAAVGRGSDGKFVRMPLPTETADKNNAGTGATNSEALRSARVPDRAVGQEAPKDVSGPSAPATAPVYSDSNPWPEAGPFNDANALPFKLRK